MAGSRLGKSVPSFVIDRILRIYPLYFVALLVHSCTVFPFFNNGQLPTGVNFCTHALSLQYVIPGAFDNKFYPTLWFVGMLSICYFFFLLLRKHMYDIRKTVILVGLVFVITLVLNTIGTHLNFELFARYTNTYLTFFLVGMYATRKHSPISLMGKGFLFLYIIGSILTISFYSIISVNDWRKQLVEYVLLIVVNCSFYLYAVNTKYEIIFPRFVAGALKTISYSSFCIFLFHGPIWEIMYKTYNESSPIQWMYIAVCGTSLIILTSWFIQFVYNKMIGQFIIFQTQHHP
jgi:peptidoglycan/LPS O-acetylase OafA/YrhL